MKTAAGIFILVILFGQICRAQQDYYYGTFDPFYFFNEVSTSAQASGKIFLNNNNDAYSSLYNPAISSYSGNIRTSYSNLQNSINGYHYFYSAYGIDVPIKSIGTFSLVRKYYEFEHDYYGYDYDYYLPNTMNTEYNFNYSREIVRGLFAGLGLNYFKWDKQSGRTDFQTIEYYSLNLGASYNYALPPMTNYLHNVFINGSISNIQLHNSKGERFWVYESTWGLPQIDHISLGYNSKYRGVEILKGMDDLQTDIQVEYSDLLNSSGYNTISFGGEIKFLEIASIRAGYYNFKYENNYNMPQTYDKFTYGFGLSFPLMLVSGIPLVIGVDYANMQNPYLYDGSKYYSSYSLNISYNLY